MHALKHPLWVLYWQLVGAVHPDGGLAGARKDSLQKCVCVSRDVPICILSTWTSGPLMQQCKPACAMQCFDVWQMGTLCAKPRQGAVPWPESQSGPGLQSHSKAAWQAALAFGWPLPPPGRPHSLTSLAWQEQPNKLRASWSSQHFHGNIPPPPPPPPLSLVSVVYELCTNTRPHKHWHLLKRVLEFMFEQTQACTSDPAMHMQGHGHINLCSRS